MTHSDQRYDARPAANRYRAGSYIIIIIIIDILKWPKQ